jgi:hemerythrin
MADKFMKWQKEFDFGIPDIDAQHHSVFDLIDELNEAFVNRETEAKMKSLLDSLKKYADNHFATEEKYFREVKFTQAAEHIKSHQAYKEKIMELIVKHNQGLNVTYALMSFLRTWWTQHILNEDKAYTWAIKIYLKKQKV